MEELNETEGPLIENNSLNDHYPSCRSRSRGVLMIRKKGDKKGRTMRKGDKTAMVNTNQNKEEHRKDQRGGVDLYLDLLLSSPNPQFVPYPAPLFLLSSLLLSCCEQKDNGKVRRDEWDGAPSFVSISGNIHWEKLIAFSAMRHPIEHQLAI